MLQSLEIMPANTITLSYLLATKNRLPYLRSTLEKLIAQKRPGEEILIADAESTDGTKEYLVGLKTAGKIDSFFSERDYGVAHGFNKLILAANGVLLKYLTDDDAYDFETIQKCKEFMLEHPEVDIINTEAGSLNNPARMVGQEDPLQVIRAITYESGYRKWRDDHTPFSFCDLGTVIRKSSLPVVGILDPACLAPDMEMSLRISSGKVNIAWYTGYSYVNISNPQSVSLKFMGKIKKLQEHLDKFYFDKNPESFLKKKARIFNNKIRSGFSVSVANQDSENFEQEWLKMTAVAEKWLRIKNAQKKPEFLFKESML